MKSLALYIDKWYIVGTVCVDGMLRPISLPNHEDRIWLYFFEDIPNDTISYSKGFETKYRNKENHYYGDVFSLITSSSAKYTVFKSPQPIRKIFDSARIFDDLRKNMEDDGEIETFISFSQDISLAAQILFLKELKAKRFAVKESVARIGHLALEHAARKNGYVDEGFYLVLDACNENLHYSLYKKTESTFVRNAEEVLSGMGMDVRRRALIEYIVDHINSSELFLKTAKEREAEYLRMDHFVDEWLDKLSAVKTQIPVSISGITLSHDHYKQYSVSVPKAKIDERTAKIVADIVRVVVEFAKDERVNHDQIHGILLLGNTFTNDQFKKEVGKKYNLPSTRILCFKDADLATLVSVYNFIDKEQFSAISGVVKGNAEEELRRIQQAEEEAKARRKAQDEAEENERVLRENEEKERKFREAMDKGYEAEREHDYVKMAEFFKIALRLQPDDPEAKQKEEEAILKIKELEVSQKTYKERIQQARKALENHDYEAAKQKAEEALGYIPESKEALHIKNESQQYLRNTKDFERYLDRADLFISQKAYKEAQDEIDKARLLNINEEELSAREAQIRNELEIIKNRIQLLTSDLENAISNKRYEDAITACYELLRADFANSDKWSKRIAEVQYMQDRAHAEAKRTKELMANIRSALQDDNWENMVAQCKEYLEISASEEVASYLELGKKKLFLSTVQADFDGAYESKDWRKVIELANEYKALKNNKENNKKINNAHRLLAIVRSQNTASKISVSPEQKKDEVKRVPTKDVTTQVEGELEEKKTKRKFPRQPKRIVSTPTTDERVEEETNNKPIRKFPKVKRK